MTLCAVNHKNYPDFAYIGLRLRPAHRSICRGDRYMAILWHWQEQFRHNDCQFSCLVKRRNKKKIKNEKIGTFHMLSVRGILGNRTHTYIITHQRVVKSQFRGQTWEEQYFWKIIIYDRTKQI